MTELPLFRRRSYIFLLVRGLNKFFCSRIQTFSNLCLVLTFESTGHEIHRPHRRRVFTRPSRHGTQQWTRRDSANGVG